MSQTTVQRRFSEQDFSALAAALDQVLPDQRELFLAKLVVLLCASGSGPDVLANAISRAINHFPGEKP